MAKKQFKAESKKLLDMMINSIYTHNDIFLRELISNASDALDKLYYHALSDGQTGSNREDYKIDISIDKENRTLTISDNGCGMSADELEKDLGTIAKSGSGEFKKSISSDESGDNSEIIGQFGVGFYSAFMVADNVKVISRKYGSDVSYIWESSGLDGFTISETQKDTVGTDIILHIKANVEPDSEGNGGEDYDKFLDQYEIQHIVKKYSDYIRYPIVLPMEKQELKEKENEDDKDEYETVIEDTQLNSMVPLWRKNKNEISKEEYDEFYKQRFGDYEDPLLSVHSKNEGSISYDSLLYVPSHAPYDFYSKDYEKGLALYSNGVLIMEKCDELLPDYFSFVKGLVDSSDLTLNISRETLQHDHILKVIARNLEKKIKSELLKLLKNDREKYEQFWAAFGYGIKHGVYANYGQNKDVLKDLLLFVSSNEKKLSTLGEYVDRMKESQDTIYYACGETVDKIMMLPGVKSVLDKGFEVLFLTADIDEFALLMMQNYNEKTFTNILASDLDLSSDEEKEALKTFNDENKELLDFVNESLGEKCKSVEFVSDLGDNAATLKSEGMLSLSMEKVYKGAPDAQGMKAEVVLGINKDHKISQKLVEMFEADDKEEIKKYAEILFDTASFICARDIENPAEFAKMVCELLV